MTRTFIFDSADPDNSNFMDEGSSSSNEAIDEDFLSFEDDLHTSDSSSSGTSSSSSGRSRLSRFRSRTSTIAGSARNSGSSDSQDSGDGRSQRFARALRAVKSGSASVVGRNRSSGDGDNSGGRRRRKNRRQRPSEDMEMENVYEEEQSAAVNIVNNQEEMIAIPFPGVLNVSNETNNEVVFGDGVRIGNNVKIGEDSDSRMPRLSPQTSGIRMRKLANGKTSQDGAFASGVDVKIDIPTRPKRANSQKRSRRRYSGSMGSAAAAQRRAGWEPGVDIRTTDIILQSIGSAVTIVDYSKTRYRIIQTEVHPAAKSDDSDVDPSLVVNREFHHHLEARPAWSQVRWISVNGLSWEAISAISKRYQLHRLAIEDMVDIPQRTKVDLYPTHTFCCLPLHKLISFKPQYKQDFNFLDWVLRREPVQQKKKFHSGKLAPSKSNTSTKSKSKSESYTSPGKEASPPIQPPNITIPADSGHRRPLNRAASAPRKIVLPNSSSSSSSSSSDNEDNHKPLNTILAAKGMETIYDWNNPYAAIQHKSQYIESKRPLAEYKRAVGVEQVSLFLTGQSTVISFFERSATDIERPLLARLSTESTILRESCDPSLLLQAIVDAIVDLLQPIIAAYRRRMDELEVDAMINPSMSHTQDLHLMAGELSMLRNTIVPITSLVLSLRDHTAAPPVPGDHVHHGSPGSDGQRNGSPPVYMQSKAAAPSANVKIPIISQGNFGPGGGSDANSFVAAAIAETAISKPALTSAASVSSSSSSLMSLNIAPTPVVEPIVGSRVSALAKVYLADISDHLLSHTQDIDVMRNNTKNMIDLIFNTISIQSSDSIGQLSLVTVIFLPLSFWTGYYGMNFTDFADLEHSTSYYWVIAVPFCVGVVILAMFAWIKQSFFRFKNYVKKRVRMHQRKVKKQLRRKARRREISHV